jgi:hypothetical protein
MAFCCTFLFHLLPNIPFKGVGVPVRARGLFLMTDYTQVMQSEYMAWTLFGSDKVMYQAE